MFGYYNNIWRKILIYRAKPKCGIFSKRTTFWSNANDDDNNNNVLFSNLTQTNYDYTFSRFMFAEINIPLKFGRAHFVSFAVECAARGFMRLTIRKSFRALDPFGKGKLNVFLHTPPRCYLYYAYCVCIILSDNITRQ